MPTSTHVSPATHRGFSLLEVMVVVTLIALFATVAMPALMRAGGGGLEDSARRLTGTLELLRERSLFRSEVLALRLSAHGYTPLRYDIDKQAFTELETDRLAAVELTEDISLEWDMDGLRDEPDLRELAKQRLNTLRESRNSDDTERKGARNPSRNGVASNQAGARGDTGEAESEEDADKEFPQVFFFPSGEASPVRFRVVEAQGETRLIRLGALGTIKRGEEEEEE